MAASDYRLCDVCNGKVFYDCNLNWEHDLDNTIRWNGEKGGGRLDYLGAWAVLCNECSQTHDAVIVPIETETNDEE